MSTRPSPTKLAPHSTDRIRLPPPPRCPETTRRGRKQADRELLLAPRRSAATFQGYFNRALGAVKNPGSLLQSTASSAAAANPASALERARNISTAQVIGGGVLLAEVLGFFTVGEIIGRFKLIGYHGETAHHH